MQKIYGIYLIRASILLSMFLVSTNAVAQYDPEAGLPGLDQALIAKAIRAMDGRSSGVVKGVQATQLKNMTRSNEPLQASVKVIQRFKQFECARVQIDVTQEMVPTRSGEFITFRMPPFELNICTDGNPPDGNNEVLPKGNWSPRPEWFAN